MNNLPLFRISERFWSGKARLLQLVAEVATSALCRNTIYLSPESLGRPVDVCYRAPEAGEKEQLASVVQQAGESDTGLVLLWCEDRVVAIAPPFPVEEDSFTKGVDTLPLVELLSRDLFVGIILLRLGRYAVGVVHGDNLVASRSGTRYVKSRHRAGGSSQRRFERSRERLVQELFGKTCQTSREVFTPFGNRIDYLLMGGDRHVLQGFVESCVFLQRSEAVTLQRMLDVKRPGRAALEQMPYEVWKSRVLVFTHDEGD